MSPVQSRVMLRTHQRNLYYYFLKNEDGNKMPFHRDFGVRTDVHVNAINTLEKLGLIQVNRVSNNYLMWTVRVLKREDDD